MRQQSTPRLIVANPDDPTGDSVLVPLTKGRFAIIDGADAERVGAVSWCAIGPNPQGKYYAGRNIGPRSSRSMLRLHRFLMEAGSYVDVDHINGDGLDCRRSNMRLATRAQNRANMGRTRLNTSGFKGVSFDKRSAKWVASIRSNGQYIHIGSFDLAEEAAHAYDVAARCHHKAFARLNFPEEGEHPA